MANDQASKDVIFDVEMNHVEGYAKRMLATKGKVVELLAYASKRRGESQGEAKTEWRRETNRLDNLRNACNLLDKALSK